jgi:hypothetical protein
MANDGHVDNVVESEIEDHAGCSQRGQPQCRALTEGLGVLWHTTVAITSSTVGGDPLRLEALDNFAHTLPNWLRGVVLNPLIEVESCSLRRSLHERKR